MTASRSTQDDAFTFAEIALRDGWSGQVLTRVAANMSTQLSQRQLPTCKQWQPILEQLVGDPAAIAGYSSLKYSRDVQIFRAEVVDDDVQLDVVLKQTQTRGTFHRMVNRFRTTRERSNFRRALEVVATGINTAFPLAIIERRSPTRQAWLVSEYVPDLKDLDLIALQLLSTLDPRSAHAVKRAIIRAVVGLFETLERSGFAHRDLKASNILLTNWDDPSSATVWLLDLDGLRRSRLTSQTRRTQPLMRLAASLLDYASVTRTDYARFLRLYFGRTGQPRDAWREAYRRIGHRAVEYLRQSRRRKTDKLDGYQDDT